MFLTPALHDDHEGDFVLRDPADVLRLHRCRGHAAVIHDGQVNVRQRRCVVHDGWVHIHVQIIVTEISKHRHVGAQRKRPRRYVPEQERRPDEQRGGEWIAGGIYEAGFFQHGHRTSSRWRRTGPPDRLERTPKVPRTISQFGLAEKRFRPKRQPTLTPFQKATRPLIWAAADFGSG